MDAIKGLASKAKEMKGNSGASTGNSGGEDYLDKGLDAAEKKAGTSQNRQTNEKITDEGRTMFEKTTGKNIPDKFSN